MPTRKPRDSLLEQFVKTAQMNNIYSTKDKIKNDIKDIEESFDKNLLLEQFIKTAQINNIHSTKDKIKNDIKDIEESFDKIHSILQRIY